MEGLLTILLIMFPFYVFPGWMGIKTAKSASDANYVKVTVTNNSAENRRVDITNNYLTPTAIFHAEPNSTTPEKSLAKGEVVNGWVVLHSTHNKPGRNLKLTADDFGELQVTISRDGDLEVTSP